MEWYIPITILPGIGLIILSTSNFLLDLNREIERLENSKSECVRIIKDKLCQLRILSISISFQYLGMMFFLISGVIASFVVNKLTSKYFLVIGVFFIIISISLLLYYSVKAISIRQKYLNIQKYKV